MEQEKEALEKKILKAETDLEKAPPGSLTYHMVDGVCRYYIQEYHNGKKKLVYLADTPENKLLKEKLVSKRMKRLLLWDYKNELEAVNAYLKKRKSYSYDNIFAKEPIWNIMAELEEEWAQANYATNTYHPLAVKVEAPDGVIVFSKSEKDISYALKEVRLPNRYEQKRNFDGRIVCPDFTIFHPLTGDVYIWEHFGKMDDDDYAKRAYEKIDLYKKNDFFPDDKLILTFEDQEHPLTNRKIQATIEYFFGDWLKMLEKLEG